MMSGLIWIGLLSATGKDEIFSTAPYPKVLVISQTAHGQYLPAAEQSQLIGKLPWSEKSFYCPLMCDLEEVRFIRLSDLEGILDRRYVDLLGKYKADIGIIFVKNSEEGYHLRFFNHHEALNPIFCTSVEKVRQAVEQKLRDVYGPSLSLNSYFLSFKEADALSIYENLKKRDDVVFVLPHHLSSEEVSFEVLSYWTEDFYELIGLFFLERPAINSLHLD